MNSIEYINLEYLRSKVGIADSITIHNVDALRNELNVEIDKLIRSSSKIDLLVIDLYNSPAGYSEEEVQKESNLFNLFKDVEGNVSISAILFVTYFNDPISGNFLIEKDFPNSEKVLVASFARKTGKSHKGGKNEDYYDFVVQRSKNVEDAVFEEISSIVFGADSTIGKKEEYLQFISRLISNRIKTLLLDNNCIEDIKEGDHILSSTPVHVNKYVNLKPVLEKHDCFNEMCCLLYHQIVRICGGVPDFIVASSRNSIYIASGLLKYFKTIKTNTVTNMIIIDQISPVTRLTNFSNLDDIKPNRKYAIIEDFCCMGTEIKIAKSILWSRGVDVESEQYPIDVFPIVSSNLYGNNTVEEFRKRKIYPLHILDNSNESEKYLMFTSSCCPICNKIKCEHSKEFNFKK